MNPNYDFPPPLNHTSRQQQQQQQQQQTTVCTSTGHPHAPPTCVSYINPAPIDIPHRNRNRRNNENREIFASGEHRMAGIGGYTTFYHQSGIGNNTPDDRNSGIGKLCYDEHGNRLSGSFTSIRRMSMRRKDSGASNTTTNTTDSLGSVGSTDSKLQRIRDKMKGSKGKMAVERCGKVLGDGDHVEVRSLDSCQVSESCRQEDVDANDASDDDGTARSSILTDRKSKPRKHSLRKLWHF